MGIVIFLIGMVVGCFVGVFILALASANNDSESIPDETDKEK